MSSTNITEFMQQVSQNQKLQAELAHILQNSDNKQQEAIELANKHGYEITLEELETEIKKRQQQETEELSNEELEAVVGGDNSNDAWIESAFNPSKW